MKEPLSGSLGRTYLTCLIITALTDGKILPEEVDFINLQAEVLGIEERVLWADVPTDLTFLDSGTVSPELALLIIKDCIFLARCDGEYSVNERDFVKRLALRLGIEAEAFERLEARLIGLWRLAERIRKP